MRRFGCRWSLALLGCLLGVLRRCGSRRSLCSVFVVGPILFLRLPRAIFFSVSRSFSTAVDHLHSHHRLLLLCWFPFVISSVLLCCWCVIVVVVVVVFVFLFLCLGLELQSLLIWVFWCGFSVFYGSMMHRLANYFSSGYGVRGTAAHRLPGYGFGEAVAVIHGTFG